MQQKRDLDDLGLTRGAEQLDLSLMQAREGCFDIDVRIAHVLDPVRPR